VFSAPKPVVPPQTIIRLPVQTALCRYRPPGAPVVEVGVQLSLAGSYLPPVGCSGYPAQTTIELPVQTAVCS
jgi:hypothetical protein